MIWCLRSQLIIHVGSLCTSTMRFFNFFLLERTLKQSLQKWQKGNFDYHALLHHAYPSHPSSYPQSSPPHYHPPSFPAHPPPSHPTSGGLEGLHALPPPLQKPVGQALGCLHTGLASSSPRPRFKNIARFEIIHKVIKDFSDIFHPDQS